MGCFLIDQIVQVPRRIFETNNATKLVLIVRNPVDRLISDYNQFRSRKLDRFFLHNLEIWAWSYFGKANEGRLEYWIFLFQGRGVSLLRRVPLHPKWQYWHWLSGRLKKNMWKYIDFFSHCRDQSTTTIWSGIKKTVGFLINDQHCHPGFQVDEILPFKPDSHCGRG